MERIKSSLKSLFDSPLRKSKQPNSELQEFKRYVIKNVEPLVEAYILEHLTKMTYPRRVKIHVREDKPWELRSVKTVTIGSNDLHSESHLAYSSGSGEWVIYIDDMKINYALMIEWDVKEKLMAVSLTPPKLELLLKGEYVGNYIGEISRIIPGPGPREIDDSILDNADAVISRFRVKYLEPDSYQQIKQRELSIETVIHQEDPMMETIDEDEYKVLEEEMKRCIQALGWKWNQIDAIKMQECIIHSLKNGEKSEVCLKRYLQKESN